MSALKDFLIFLGIVTLILIICTVAKAETKEEKNWVKYKELIMSREVILPNTFVFNRDCYESIKDFGQNEDIIAIEFNLTDKCKGSENE